MKEGRSGYMGRCMIFENEIGEGWKNVVTKDKNGWRSREVLG